jgi:hypothetical protein
MIKKIIVLCDGTWCGNITGTISNIKIIADLISNKNYKKNNTFINDNIIGQYFEGIGIEGNFSEYIINGAMALDIKKECIKVYNFIVDNFDNNSEIWMFGLSRGAYTIRCVAGMINNCGILDKSKSNEEDRDNILFEEIYKIYRSKNKNDKPNSIETIKFKNKFSHITNKPPIKFMGLLDTVGSLGIPKIKSGLYLEYEEFYDQNVSGEVQNVYQALSIHDRLSLFEPCFIRRNKLDNQFIYNYGKNKNNADFINYNTKEVWFPGAHYDIGRQRFVFTRKYNNFFEKLIHNILNYFNIFVIEPNNEYADYVLKWMIELIKETDSSLLKKTNEQKLKNELIFSGDIYDKFMNIIKLIIGHFLRIFFIQILNQQLLRDRRIVPYYDANFCNCPKKYLKSSNKYKSKTYDTYIYIKNAISN